ncbi:uncharacterized protein LOC143244089 [Tachypleus tridentatus]|uniref:uncharacterized protein LOC143244089 n=1 Tax=Tachypleus tridentatus TaxID=6853 RepID=UPI003FD146C5
MNPLTNVKNITKLNEKELSLGIDSKTSWHNLYKHSAWIFLGGLSYDLTEGDIICVFSQYGEVVNINLVRDKKTGKSRGFCFLCYEDQRSTVLAVDNLNGIKLCGKTIRVDHIENFKIPKECDSDDAVSKTLRLEGCAPKPPELPPYQLVKDVPKIKKEKKKKREKKKQKESKKLSDRDSSSSNVSTKDIKPTNKEKEGKNDLGHNKDTSFSYHNSPQKQKYDNQSETSVRSSNIPARSKLPGERSRETELNCSRHRSRSPLSATQNSSRGSLSNKNFKKESPSDEWKHRAKCKPKNGQEKGEEKRHLLKHISWNKEYNKSQDEGRVETRNNDWQSSRADRNRKEYGIGKRQRDNDFYKQERPINQDYKGPKRFLDQRSRSSLLQGRFDELHHGRRDCEINLGFMNNDSRRYTEQQFNYANGNSRYLECIQDTEDFIDRRRRDWEICTSYTEREKELEWLRKREFEIQRERAREGYNLREEFGGDFKLDRNCYEDFSHIPRNKSKNRISYRPKDRSRSWNDKNSIRQPRIPQR